jgi:hypothetical protein
MLSGVSVFLMPYTAPIIYPWLFFTSIGFMLGAGPYAAVIVNDYVTKETRGRGFSLY